MTTTPHKHAEVIKAWADGAQVQVHTENGWRDMHSAPTWLSQNVYRVKPAAPVRKYPETTMTDAELIATIKERLNPMKNLRDCVNAALRHAIDNGQVVMPEDEECRKYMPAGIAHLIQSYREMDRDFIEAITSQSKFGKSKS